MVTHTWNSCSAFNPSKVYTHSSEHTPGGEGSHLCCGSPGSSLGFGALLKGTSIVVLRVERERWTFTPPTYNFCRPETRTRNLSITSPTLYPLGYDFPICPRFVSKVPTMAFRDQVVNLQALSLEEADPALALLCLTLS